MKTINYCKILTSAKRIAIVGFSRNADRTSRHIADYLKENGYEVLGVNPGIIQNTMDGFQVYKSLKEIPGDLDIINVFRKSEDIPALIPDVLAKGCKTLWLQLGIRNDEAVEVVMEKGIETIQDRCILVEHRNCFN
ncbi:MAG: CoA-binding protein [Melioribacteraceae bacterium]|nr:CoA-binding protein [Melioribacteraceae bacterium]